MQERFIRQQQLRAEHDLRLAHEMSASRDYASVQFVPSEDQHVTKEHDYQRQVFDHDEIEVRNTRTQLVA